MFGPAVISMKPLFYNFGFSFCPGILIFFSFLTVSPLAVWDELIALASLVFVIFISYTY